LTHPEALRHELRAARRVDQNEQPDRDKHISDAEDVVEDRDGIGDGEYIAEEQELWVVHCC
jgi:hypothetical protein